MSNETSKPTEARELPTEITEQIENVSCDKSSSPSDWSWIKQYMINGAMITHRYYASQQSEIERLKAELEEVRRRHQIIMTEPNGIVRDTMISDLLS